MDRIESAEKVMQWLVKDGWNENTARGMCDKYYDLAVDKGKRKVKELAEFIKWSACWFGATGRELQ